MYFSQSATQTRLLRVQAKGVSASNFLVSILSKLAFIQSKLNAAGTSLKDMKHRQTRKSSKNSRFSILIHNSAVVMIKADITFDANERLCT